MNDIELRKVDSKESRGYYFGMDDRNKQIIRAGLIVGTICGFLWFVWPTPYEFTRKFPEVVRVNRFTGISEQSTESGWKTKGAILKERRAREESEDLKFKEIGEEVYRDLSIESWEIQENFPGSSLAEFRLQIRNGSDKTIKVIILEFDFINDEGEMVFSNEAYSDPRRFVKAQPGESFEVSGQLVDKGPFDMIKNLKLGGFKSIIAE